MLHHFCDARHPRGQGAISAEEFRSLIEYVGRDRILSAAEWFDRSLRDALHPDHLCLTFDDSLLCQFDVAWPVMEEFGLTGFFFVYSSAIKGEAEPLEIYRYFRTTTFDSIVKFYDAFNAVARERFPEKILRIEAAETAGYLANFPYFTEEDRLFRYIRDEVLDTRDYDRIMDEMMEEAGFDVGEASEMLWMNERQLEHLARAGNTIGLHSYNHPMAMERLSFEEQAKQYRLNHRHISEVLNAPITTMSHPSNSYNTNTLEILQDLDIKLGFRANMVDVQGRSMLEMPREDHANIMGMI